MQNLGGGGEGGQTKSVMALFDVSIYRRHRSSSRQIINLASNNSNSNTATEALKILVSSASIGAQIA